MVSDVSRKMLTRILERSHSSISEKDQLARRFNHSKSPKEKVNKGRLRLSSDQHQIVAEWQHFAILSLIQTQNCQKSAIWLGKRLGISTKVAGESLARLERLGLIRKHQQGFEVTNKAVDSQDEIDSNDLKNLHRQIMELGIEKLYETTVSERDFTMMTLAIDPQKLPAAKKRIRAFLTVMEKLLESGSQCEVYSLAIQLIPLSIKEDQR